MREGKDMSSIYNDSVLWEEKEREAKHFRKESMARNYTSEDL